MYKHLPLAATCLVLQAALFAQTPTTLSIDTTAKAQTIAGFGAAIGYFDNWVTAHPNKGEVYKLIFSDLDLGILRLRNTFGYPNSSTADPAEIVQQASLSLNRPVEILLSSWSPPANLKLNGTLNGGTLLKTNGQFVYTGFAQWWSDSLQWYASAGIRPAYISLQNEPDFETTSWETSILRPMESASFPGYGPALTALYNKLQGMPNRPKILGAEVTGLGFNNFQNYTDNLNRALLDGYAYHLYNGGDANNPDSFNPNLAVLKVTYNDKPNIMTEFSGGTWFNTAWLIQNCLLNANASGYLYWDLIWGRPFGTGGLISLESPWDRASWTTTTGYVINPQYYALKHFSKSISKGFVRVLSSAANSNLRSSTFLSADGSKLVAVVINVGTSAHSASFALTGFSASAVTGYQSVENNYYRTLLGIAPTGSVVLPGLSVTTLEFTKGASVVILTTGVQVTPVSSSIAVGSTTTLTASVTPANATNKTVSWSSSATSVATVNAVGVVTGVSAGSTTVTATTQSGGFTARTAITVSGGSVSTPCANPTPATLPLVRNGAGEYCLVITGTINSINSWNAQLVEVNGASFTNRWANSLPPRINGNYYIRYVAGVSWAHLEVN